MTMDNLDRADSVESLLASFAEQSGLDPNIDADGPQTVAGDIICNILHWVALNDPAGRAAALTAVKNGIGHYIAESYIDYDDEDADELGPDAFVEINASCNGETWISQSGIEAKIIPNAP